MPVAPQTAGLKWDARRLTHKAMRHQLALPSEVARSGPDQFTAKKFRRLLLGVGVTFIGIACLTGFAGVLLSTSTPDWWDQAVRPGDDTPEHARDFEALIVTELNRVREGARPAPGAPWKSEPWAIAVHSQDVNAWLAHSAPRWLTNQSRDARWPKDLSDIRVRFDENHWYIGARIRGRAFDRTISAVVHPRIAPDGSLWLDAEAVELGNLSLPAQLALKRAPKLIEAYLPSALSSSPEAGQLLSTLQGTTPLSRQPTFRLADGRQVRVLELKSSQDRLEIVAQTERR